jgi:hypothetical protein
MTSLGVILVVLLENASIRGSMPSCCYDGKTFEEKEMTIVFFPCKLIIGFFIKLNFN